MVNNTALLTTNFVLLNLLKTQLLFCSVPFWKYHSFLFGSLCFWSEMPLLSWQRNWHECGPVVALLCCTPSEHCGSSESATTHRKTFAAKMITSSLQCFLKCCTISGQIVHSFSVSLANSKVVFDFTVEPYQYFWLNDTIK